LWCRIRRPDFKQPKDVPNWILCANIIDQTSNGANLLAGMPFQTYQASTKVQMSYVGSTAYAAGSTPGDQQKIFSPFGTKPNYTDMSRFRSTTPMKRLSGPAWPTTLAMRSAAMASLA
jgi:hypothetical protein